MNRLKGALLVLRKRGWCLREKREMDCARWFTSAREMILLYGEKRSGSPEKYAWIGGSDAALSRRKRRRRFDAAEAECDQM
jgi:hypothetical protein